MLTALGKASVANGHVYPAMHGAHGPRAGSRYPGRMAQAVVLQQPEVETAMTTFNEREKGFEKKFTHDQDLKFKAESRRNKLLGEWAAGLMGMSGTAVEDYVKAVRKADLAEKGDADVLRKVLKDLTDKGVKMTEADVAKKLHEFLAEAVAQIESAPKT